MQESSTDHFARIFMTAACDAVLSTWCHSNCPHSTSHELFARFDAGAGGGPPAWRCYARETLSADLSTYVRGTTYCTRHQSLVDLHASCSADGFSPELSARPPSPSVPIPSAAPVAQPVDADGAMSCSDGVELEKWPVGSSSVVTVPAVDTRTWAPSSKRELFGVRAWELPCIDKFDQHKLNNYTRNVSRRKAFLDRTGLKCHGRCVRGVVDGFATHAEMDELRRTLAPKALPGQPATIVTFRWDVPDSPPVFRMLVARAATVLAERYGVRQLRFYRSNIIRWTGNSKPRAEWPVPPLDWTPGSLHGDTNTDEMFLFTTIMYLSQHGEDVKGGETGIADEVDHGKAPGGTGTRVTAGLRIEPSIGRLLVFSSGVENMHEMLPVTHGERIACQMWFACEGMDPGWAHEQRIAFERQHGYGGPDGIGAGVPKETSPQMSVALSAALAKPWPWRAKSR